MATIQRITAREILDSRGNPTVEADVILQDGTLGRSSVPSGASTGIHEAVELRDNNPKRYMGKGVLKAVNHVNNLINNTLSGVDVTDQEKIDTLLINLDGTENKSNLGANAMLSVSLAAAYAAAKSQKKELYEYVSVLAGNTLDYILPLPMMNIINGGRHANWVTDLQEYMIFPVGAENFSHAIQMGAEIFHMLGKVLDEKGYSTAVGDEGGYAPLVRQGNSEPLDLISIAVAKSGYKMGKDIVFALDGAASEFYKDGTYQLKNEGKKLNADEMIEWLTALSKKYPIVSMEDCLDQQDWNGWKKLTEKLGSTIQIVGDDLFVTNRKFLEKGIAEKSGNAILIKVNQIGTLSETIATIKMAKKHNWHSIISHRSGETEDTTIADLAVGLSTGQIKTGSLSRSERTAKYNRLLRIAEHLGNKAVFAANALKK